MDLIEIFKIFFGAIFIIAALTGGVYIFGGIFYTKKVKAFVGDIKVTKSTYIDGVRYSDGYDRKLAIQRDRRRHMQSGDRRKRTYNTNRVERISFTYEDNGQVYKTNPKTTICPVSTSFVNKSGEYTIKVSRSNPRKARLGLFEVLKEVMKGDNNIIIRLIISIIVIGNALLYVAGAVGIGALGAWMIHSALK